ncbi:MAG: methylenetetrahydrofolate--tRNA-(uracil(54)-C(5))-methyltransferase (FADH(2)-oxidizing) TrmFO [Clostridia bacterium]
MKAIVIGAGLAGCESAYQLAKRGVKVTLYDMKPHKKSPAHTLNTFSELVCSNSLRSNDLSNAVGLLKEEMRKLGSIIMEAADNTSVPAGGALAVDRDEFSKYVTNKIKAFENITVCDKEITEIPQGEKVIIATGPLTSDGLSESIAKLLKNDYLHFFDAAAPIVEKSSIDFDLAYYAARYDKGEADYINCPMTKSEYDVFYNELINAKVAELHEFDKKSMQLFSGCMPIEEMARNGEQTMLYGPLKPVGLTNPKTNTGDYAVVQLRQDNKEATLYNIVGFQTHLKFSEQKRVFGLIPALKNAEFVRYGVMHRNTFLDSPKVLTDNYNLSKNNDIYFAGQITGVEGYIESASSGMLAGIALARELLGQEKIDFDRNTEIGALSKYVTDKTIKHFQPMNASFGIMAPPSYKVHSKKEKNEHLAKRSLEFINSIKDKI